jgi:protein-S-isoprenylcysteine O-methyltransferase Ste14
MTFDESDDAHGFNGRLFKFIAGLELVVVAIYSFGGSWYDYLLPFWYLEKNYLEIIGWVLIHISLVWVFIAQLHMADSWRIGIDQKNKTELVTHGLFSISRNPIFFGILLADLGLFLIAPNAFTLLVAVLSYATIQTQVRLEEDFLKESHGENYQEYFRKVRRWI